MIAIAQYPEGGKMEIKTGHLIEIINENIRHTVTTSNVLLVLLLFY